MIGNGVGRAQHINRGTVGEMDQQDRLARCCLVEDRRQHDGRVRRAGIADLAGEISDELVAGNTGQSAHRACVHADDRDLVDLVKPDARVGERTLDGVVGERQVHLLAEPFLPDPRERIARLPVAISEFSRGDSAAEPLAQHR